MPINIKISNFEGPFDLLLHLIKKNEMDIYDIKIQEITEQYINYIHYMKDMDLEVASEFIVMASTLIEIKSRMLLPKPEKDEGEDEDDPRQPLVSKLIEYKKFKAAALDLKVYEQKSGMVFTKKPETIDDRKNNSTEFLKNVNLIDLYNIYKALMKKYNGKFNSIKRLSPGIVNDKYKVEDKIFEIREKCLNKGQFFFSEIAGRCECKIELIVSFIAILEMARLKEIYLYQHGENDILVERKNKDGR